jgi:predicted transport protein
MSFQAYLDNIKAKTGKGPDDFRKLAAKKNLLGPDVKAGEVVAWLKKDFDLGHGHAMAIYATLKGVDKKQPTTKGVDKYFSGNRLEARPLFDKLMKTVAAFGEDITVAPGTSYISILRDKKKIAIVQVTAKRMDVGIKLKGAPATTRFALAGTWNSMVTHRVQLTKAQEIDSELLAWLQSAYEQSGPKSWSVKK